MSYNESHTIEISHLKTVSEAVKTALDVISARMDAQVTATTEADADYAAEVVDGRVDALGHIHGSLGANIRAGQQERQESEFMIQQQLQELSEAVLKLSVMFFGMNEKLLERKQEE